MLFSLGSALRHAISDLYSWFINILCTHPLFLSGAVEELTKELSR